MADTLLSDLPAEAQEALKGMSRAQLEFLLCEVRGHQLDAQVSQYPADAEAAAQGARYALRREATITVEDPLDMLVSLFNVTRMMLAHGSTEDLDRTDCLHLWKVTDMADDLLRAHVAAVGEAGLRLRAHTHPPAPRNGGAG